MHDHILGVGQPHETPPQSPRQERTEGDVTRSDSYCLARGGKVVSSRPWAANGIHALNMRAVERGKNVADGQHPLSPSSEVSSSDSESDSGSGDSEETSEDEYETSDGRAALGLLPCTIPEEEHDTSHLDTGGHSDVSGQAVGACDIRGNSPGDAHPRPGPVNARKPVRQDAAARAKENPLRNVGNDCDPDENDDDDDDDDEDEEEEEEEEEDDDEEEEEEDEEEEDEEEEEEEHENEEEDSESEETESTVRAKRDGVSAHTEAEDRSTPLREEEDHNDTLSTLSGDFSFDDQEPSPPRDLERVGDSESASNSRRPPSPTIPSDEACPATGGDEHTAAQEHVAGRPVPDGEGSSPQREGMRAGVFCISGYPRPNQASIHTVNEASLSEHRIDSGRSHYDSSTLASEDAEDAGRGAEHTRGAMDSVRADYSWDNLSYVLDRGGSVQRSPFFQQHSSTATYGTPPQASWPSSLPRTAPSTSRSTDSTRGSTDSHYQNVESLAHYRHRSPTTTTTTHHTQGVSPASGMFTSAHHHDPSLISLSEQHRALNDQHMRSEARRRYSSSPQPQPRQRNQQDSRRPHSTVYDDVNNSSSNTSNAYIKVIILRL